MKLYLHTYKLHILLVGIVALSLFLRLYNFSSRAFWIGDIGRDLLVAYHMVHFGEFPAVGHCTTYDFGYYPPYYYLLVAAVTAIHDNPLFVMGSFAGYIGLLPLFVFFIGKRLFSTRAGLLAAFFVAVSSHMIRASNLWSAYIAPAIFYLGLTILAQHREHVDRSIMFLGLMIIMFSGFINYALFPLICITVFFVLLTRKSIREKLFIFIFCFLSFFVLYSPILLVPESLPIFKNLTGSHLVPTELLSRSFSSYFSMWMELFMNDIYPALATGACILIVVIISLIQHRIVLKKAIYAMCCVMSLPFLGSLLKEGPVEPYLFEAAYPLLLLLIAWVCTETLHKNKPLVQGVVSVCISIILFCLIGDTKNIFRHGEGAYQKTQKIVSYLENYAAESGIRIPLFFIGGSESNAAFWESPQYWYVIERASGRKFVHVTNDGENLEQTIEPDAYGYLICRDYQELVFRDCVDQILRKMTGYYVMREVPHDFESYNIYLIAPK